MLEAITYKFDNVYMPKFRDTWHQVKEFFVS